MKELMELNGKTNYKSKKKRPNRKPQVIVTNNLVVTADPNISKEQMTEILIEVQSKFEEIRKPIKT